MSFSQRSAPANEDLIKRLFNKVYSAIISEKIFCPPETAVYLAAYACQAKFGSAQGLRNPLPPVKELLPKSILDNHNLTITDWETRISNWHLKLRGVPFLDAIVEYVDTAQDVELYGASIFEIETSDQEHQWISLDAVGLNIFKSKRRPPNNRYVWSDIKSFDVWNKKIEIVLSHKPDQVIDFYVQNQVSSDLIRGLFLGSKELYSRRKKGELSMKYVQRSESNSTLRMKPHTLTPKQLFELEQQITELELELPRRATDYEYAPWQVKDQLRQTSGMEAKLALNKPSTDDTRRLQYRVAQMRVFLEQDFFNTQKETNDRPHKYRGNFAIRIGGSFSGRLDGYVSDIDSGSETPKGTPVWSSSSKNAKTPSDEGTNVGPSSIHVKNPSTQVHAAPPSPMQGNRRRDSDGSSSSSSVSSSAANYVGAPNTRMPTLPPTLLAGQGYQRQQTPKEGATGKPSYNEEAYPKTAVPRKSSLTADEPLSANTAPSTHWDGPGYPEMDGGAARSNMMPTGSETVEPPASVTSPSAWQHALRIPSQEQTDSTTRGRKHGQILEPENAPQMYRPPVQPKSQVARKATGDPHIVTPDNYGDGNNVGAAGNDLKFSSLKGIQSGFTKKRVDLFEAL